MDRDQSAPEIAAADLICAALTFQSSLLAPRPADFWTSTRHVATHRKTTSGIYACVPPGIGTRRTTVAACWIFSSLLKHFCIGYDVEEQTAQ